MASFGENDNRTVIGSSIIAANEAPDPNPSAGTDVDFVFGDANSFESEGDNVIGDGNAISAFDQPGDRTSVSVARLGPLADNGGPTKTHALLSGSLAIDRVAPRVARHRRRTSGAGTVPGTATATARRFVTRAPSRNLHRLRPVTMAKTMTEMAGRTSRTLDAPRDRTTQSGTGRSPTALSGARRAMTRCWVPSAGT